MVTLAALELGMIFIGTEQPGDAAALLVEAIARTWGLREDAIISREPREDVLFPCALLAMAALAAATGRPADAAGLLGAADAVAPLPAYAEFIDWRDRELMERCLARLSDALDPHDLHRLRQGGTALSISQAVVLARDFAASVIGAASVDEIWRATGAPDPGPQSAVTDLDAEKSQGLDVHAEAKSLTFREQEVLTLLCQRLTDAEIAERLFLSPRTASRHVGSIIAKLGAGNRREAAAIAARQHLI
jgi:DNA-binding CsgD family transcriptional regulator